MNIEKLNRANKIDRSIRHLEMHYDLVLNCFDEDKINKGPYISIQVPGYINGGYDLLPELVDYTTIHNEYIGILRKKIEALKLEFSEL